jgi:hypothetical protein
VQELDDERRRERAFRFGLFAQHPLDDRLGIALARAEEHAPSPRAIARAPRGDDVGGEAAQLFDEREAQHDRDGPDLADRQRRDALIRGREVHEDLQIEAAGRMRRDLAGDQVHARIARELSVRELRQLHVVLARQVLADLANLILNDVVVVAEPLFRSDGGRVGGRRFRQKAVRVLELLSGVVEARQQRLAACGLRREARRLRQHRGVAVQLILSEQLRWCRTFGGRFRFGRMGNR